MNPYGLIMILPHGPSPDLKGSSCYARQLRSTAAQRGYDAMKLLAACGTPFSFIHRRKMSGGVARYGKINNRRGIPCVLHNAPFIRRRLSSLLYRLKNLQRGKGAYMQGNARLTSKEKLNKMPVSGNSVNLDNRIGNALSPVQVTQERKTLNGCYVTMIFPLVTKPGVKKGIAELLLSTFERQERVGNTA